MACACGRVGRWGELGVVEVGVWWWWHGVHTFKEGASLKHQHLHQHYQLPQTPQFTDRLNNMHVIEDSGTSRDGLPRDWPKQPTILFASLCVPVACVLFFCSLGKVGLKPPSKLLFGKSSFPIVCCWPRVEDSAFPFRRVPPAHSDLGTTIQGPQA